jgi:hypothetical protein
MVKSGSSQVHTSPNGAGNDSEGLHVCYPCNDTEILGLLMCKTFDRLCNSPETVAVTI